ncbi:MAG: hypothetical protein GY820_47975 [Gammaproteobacteria bacterium]|nr:hypothetical protein [Gammaproteobacteria bacterium]
MKINPEAKSGEALVILTARLENGTISLGEVAIGHATLEVVIVKSLVINKVQARVSPDFSIDGHSVDIHADLIIINNKLVFTAFALEGSYKLSELPGGGGIPNGDRFELNEIKIAKAGIEARTTLGGRPSNVYLFKINNQWIFAISQENFTLPSILPTINVDALKNITFKKAALMISKDGLQSGFAKELPPIIQDLLFDITKKPGLSLHIPSGIALITQFETDNMGKIGDAFGKVGVHQDGTIIGAITGVFTGTPGLQLNLSLESVGVPSGLPNKILSFTENLIPEFFIQWNEEEFDIGLEVALNVKVGGEMLAFEGGIELALGEKGPSIDLIAEMASEWEQPFGIKGLTLSNVILKVGVNAALEVNMGFSGSDIIGKEQVAFATSMTVALEDLLPDGIAFAGTINRLAVPDIIDITGALMGTEGKLDSIQIPFFEIHDAILAFATPGATDPQLGLIAEGFALQGTFFFMNTELGSVTASASPRSGFVMQANIDNLNLGIFELKHNAIDFQVNLTPKFIMTSKLKLWSALSDITIDLEPPNFDFEITENMGEFGDADLKVHMQGVDLMRGTFDKNSDISIVGQFNSDLVHWMKAEIRQGIHDLKKSALSKLDTDKKALSKALKDVSSLNRQIQHLKAQDKKAAHKATQNLAPAKKRVSRLKDDYDHADHEMHHCGSSWTHWACSKKWAVQKEAIKISYEAAKKILEAAKKTVAKAEDLDPRIIALKTSRDIARESLTISKAVVSVSKEAEKFILRDLESILTKALNDFPFIVDQAILLGDLRAMKQHGDPLILDMSFSMFGKSMREYFAIKINDPAFDAVSFALLPALAIDKMTESALAKLDPAARHWIHSHIATQLATAQDNVHDAVKTEEAKYADVLNSFHSGAASSRDGFSAHVDDLMDTISQTQATDLYPDSLGYKNTYLAVGHSSLCLGVDTNGIDVIQENCKNNTNERWSTEPVTNGYVHFKSKGLCLKAKNDDITKGQPLMLSTCVNNDLSQHWKIISSDGFYEKIVNRFAQQCLHFNTENANASSSYAVWTPCLGADSQTFRAIKDAESATFHKVNALLQSDSGQCLSIKTGLLSSSDSSALGKVFKSGQITQAQYNQLKQQGDDGLFVEKCSSDDDRFNYTEEVNGDIKLVHAGTGWCVYPQSNSKNTLALAPCIRTNAMYWRLNEVSGNDWTLQNQDNKLCLDLPEPTGSRSQPASMSTCNQNDEQLFSFNSQ